MIKTNLYAFMILSIAGGLLTLLGSVGIFISIIVQRRLDRLQDILEEFISLSYRSGLNITGLMYSLIEKYQMNYIFPAKPRFLILRYIDTNIYLVLLLWAITFFVYFEPPASPFLLLQLFPLVIGAYASLFFRRLLRDTINLENPLLETIIPAPCKLRSISYLSHFVNLSVDSILKQARLSLHLRLNREDDPVNVLVSLKEELSYDDFFYYLILQQDENPIFIAFGEILFHFSPDPITGKPVPVCRNINVPLGEFIIQCSTDNNISARFLVFTHGEKHPVQYSYHLVKGSWFLFSASNPDLLVNHQIVYRIERKKIRILANNTTIPYFYELSPYFSLDGNRYYLDPSQVSTQDISLFIKPCTDTVFID